MKLAIQRVSKANVRVKDKTVGSINKGLVVFLGIGQNDTDEDIKWLISKLINLRIFNDSDGRMNASIQDIKGSFLVISQFTLIASTKKGNRPSFVYAAKPHRAKLLYDKFNDSLKTISNLEVQTGIFGANMQVNLTNEGPVTILLDTKNKE